MDTNADSARVGTIWGPTAEPSSLIAQELAAMQLLPHSSLSIRSPLTDHVRHPPLAAVAELLPREDQR